MAASAEAMCPAGEKARSLGLSCGVQQQPWGLWVLPQGGRRAAVTGYILFLAPSCFLLLPTLQAKTGGSKAQKGSGAGLSWWLAEGKLEPTF